MRAMRNRSTRTTRAALLASALLFVGFLITLLPALPHVAFLPGRTLDTISARPVGDATTGQTGLAILDLVIKILLILLLISVIVLLYRVSSRTFWRAALLFLVLVGIGYLLLVSTPDGPASEPARDHSPPHHGIPSSEAAEEPELDEAPPPAMRSLDRTRTADTLLALLIATAAVTLIAALVIAHRRRSRFPPGPMPTLMDSIARATDRILAGEDPHTVVFRCYREMLATLSAQQRIDPTCLTPREFTHRLRQAGLSDDHVTELTAMFEIVRYGDLVDASFAPRAAACLQSIQEAHASEHP